MTMHWTETQEFFEAGYEYTSNWGEMPSDLSDFNSEEKRVYIEGAREGLASYWERQGVPAMTSSEMHELENC